MTKPKGKPPGGETLDHLVEFLTETTSEKNIEEIKEDARLRGEDPDRSLQHIKAMAEKRLASHAFDHEARIAPTRSTSDMPPGAEADDTCGDRMTAAVRHKSGRHGAMALAAGLILGVALGVGGASWYARIKASSQHDETSRARLDRLTLENQALRDQRAQTTRELAQLAEQNQLLKAIPPSLNFPILEAHPVGSVRDPDPQAVVRAPVPRHASSLALILHSEKPAKSLEHSVELRDPKGAVVWTASGLRYNEAVNGHTLLLPIKDLPGGRYTLHVYPNAQRAGKPVDSYLLELRPTP